jgi:peptide deformylase
MILPIRLYPDSLLKQKGELVNSDYPELKKLTEDMFETMYAANGIGLAAQQIGLTLQLFVVDISHYSEDDEKLKDFKKVFINTEILETSEDTKDVEEGCLSFPGLHVNVKRPERIRIKYFDENFIEHDEWFDSIAARCILHEYDHTQGIVFTDRIDGLRRALIKSKLDKIVKRNFLTNYKVKR